MAFWNAPLDDPDHANNAVRAAQAMRRKLVELNRGWAEEAAAAGTLFRRCRWGSGSIPANACVGNFGSEQHFDYSLLGDPVNLASRLEGLGKVYGIDLVIGEETAAHLDEPALIEVDLVAVKGKTQAGQVYTLPPERSRRASSPTGIGRCCAPIAIRIGRRRCACSTTAASPRRAIWLRSTIFTGSESPISRPRRRRAIGTGCLPPRRNDGAHLLKVNSLIGNAGAAENLPTLCQLGNRIDFI